MTLSRIKEQFQGTGQVFRFTFLQLIKSRSTIVTMLITLLLALGALPVMTLVNGGSASASEILAGAIKDYGKGYLLGTTTYGKGIVQRVIGLNDGSAVKLTVSHYYTPLGNDIHGVGIEPDEVLEFDVDAYLEDIENDNQLDRAIEIIKEDIK